MQKVAIQSMIRLLKVGMKLPQQNYAAKSQILLKIIFLCLFTIALFREFGRNIEIENSEKF